MKVMVLANNWVGWQLVSWLSKRIDAEIVGLVIHPDQKQKYGREIVSAADLPKDKIFNGSKLRQKEVRDQIAALPAELALSIYFGYILKPDFLDIFPQGVINLHPSYLPYNRGTHPNIWSIVDETPAGVSLHYIDSGIDTGQIISRRLVNVDPTDTGKTLYQKLERASVNLFCDMWPEIVAGRFTSKEQILEEGTFHRAKDVSSIDEINLNEKYRAGDLLNILRARTFPPYPGAFFWHNGRKIYIRVQLLNEDDLSHE